MKPLFDSKNLPPPPKVPVAPPVFTPMTFGNVPQKSAPQQPTIQRPVVKAAAFTTTCREIDSALTDVEIVRIQRIVLEIGAATNKQAFATEIITLITEQTEKVFQCVTSYDNASSTTAVQDFVDMMNQFATCRKQVSMTSLFSIFSVKKTFADLLILLRQSLSTVKNAECRFSAELSALQKKQTAIDDSATTCKHYLNYVHQFAVAGKVYLKTNPDSTIITVVEKLDSVYPATLTTSIAQLVLLSKTNNMITSRIQDIIQFKIPQWKQNAATILVVAEQKKLQGINSEVEANFDALLKLI